MEVWRPFPNDPALMNHLEAEDSLAAGSGEAPLIARLPSRPAINYATGLGFLSARPGSWG